MATEYTVYPLGYLGIKKDSVNDLEPDEKVERFYGIMEGRTVLNRDNDFEYLDWAHYIRVVLEYAYHQFQPFGGWLGFCAIQQEHGKLSRYKRLFLEDTCRFIETGKRDISVESWISFLQPENTELRERGDHSEKRVMVSLSKEIDKSVLAQWISYPDGIRDLVWTLKILFGQIRN